MATSIINPENMTNWTFAAESGTTFSGTISPCMTVGGYECGARLEVDDTASGGFIGLAASSGATAIPSIAYSGAAYAGLPFSAFLTLCYAAYKEVGDAAPQITLQFDITQDLTNHALDNTWQGRAVFEPYLAEGGSVASGVWQRHNALHGAGWWFTHTPMSAFAGQNNPVTMAQILARYPNMGISPSLALALVCLKAGSGWNKFIGYVNDLVIGTKIMTDRWFFEPVVGFCPYYNSTEV